MQNKMMAYEAEKAKIAREAKTTEEYQQRMRELAKRLKI
jgi:hypothetical protein